MKFDRSTQTLIANRDATNYIFFSDLHGNANSIGLIKQAVNDYPEAQIVGGGDYIDGRKNSKAVVDYLMGLVSNRDAIILKGNHEQMMLDFANGLDEAKLWYYNGGKKTVRSFFGRGWGVSKTEEALRQSKYYSFFSKVPIMLQTPNYLFLHAGVKPVQDFANQSLYRVEDVNLKPYDFYRLWAREEYFYGDGIFKYFAHNYTGKTIVTGHTPTAMISGQFSDGRELIKAPFTKCIVKTIQYPHEPARIMTDNGCHSKYPAHDGNIVVLNNQGRIVKIYDQRHPLGENWTEYAEENAKYLTN